MPPRVTKQTPNGSSPLPQKTGTIADRIVAASEIRTGYKVCIYGRGKTGKTRLACTFPKPLLILGTEDGTKSISDPKQYPDVSFLRIQGTDDMLEVAPLLQDGAYKTVVLDTAGGYQDIVLRDVLGLDAVPVSKFKQAGKGETWGITDRGTWGTVGTRFKECMNGLLSLADKSETNIVVIAHERGLDDSGPAASDVMIPTIGPALTPSAAAWLNAACDYVCNMFIREQTVSKTEDLGMGPVVIVDKTGKKEYCLRIGPHSIYATGFRHSLPSEKDLPEIVVNPTYEKLHKLITGG